MGMEAGVPGEGDQVTWGGCQAGVGKAVSHTLEGLTS